MRRQRHPRTWDPVTSPVRTLIDIARQLDLETLEQAINEADKCDLVNP